MKSTIITGIFAITLVLATDVTVTIYDDVNKIVATSIWKMPYDFVNQLAPTL